MSKIIFVHPAIRQYRKKLFELLSQQLGVRFIFVEDYEHNLDFVKKTAIKNWKAYKSGGFLFYSKGATFKLLKDVFGDYDIWISSGLGHFSTHLAFPFVKFRGKKFILFAEDWWFSKGLKSFLFRPLAKLIAKRSDAIIAAGTKTKDFFINLGVKSEKIFVAYNATDSCGGQFVDEKKLNDLRLKLNLENKFAILYLGRIVKYKGLDILIRAFSKIETETKNAVLLVVGDGDFKKECFAIADELNIKNIKWIGEILPDEAVYYYKLASVFVLPARFLCKENVVAEAWGFTINESLSCGVPVVATDAVAAAQDLVRDGISGFVVKAGDENEFYKKIKILSDNLILLENLKRGAKTMIKDITPESQFAVFKDLIELFKK